MSYRDSDLINYFKDLEESGIRELLKQKRNKTLAFGVSFFLFGGFLVTISEDLDRYHSWQAETASFVFLLPGLLLICGGLLSIAFGFTSIAKHASELRIRISVALDYEQVHTLRELYQHLHRWYR